MARPVHRSPRRARSAAAGSSTVHGRHAAVAASRLAVRLAGLAGLVPGVALALGVAAGAQWLSATVGGAAMLLALVGGLMLQRVAASPTFEPGVQLCVRGVLRVGVALLGARVAVDAVAGLGLAAVVAVVGGVATTVAVGVLGARWFGLDRSRGAVCGASVAICGATAALAVCAACPPDRTRERFTAAVAATVTVLSTMAMAAYPLLARALDLPPLAAGLFLGGSIHDVAQVVGAGYLLGPATGDAAVVVKLCRVSLLALVLLAVVTATRSGADASAAASGAARTRPPLVPAFLLVFVLLAALRSAGALPEAAVDAAGVVSRVALLTALAALGLRTVPGDLLAVGWRPLVLLVAESAWLGAWMLAAAWLGAR